MDISPQLLRKIKRRLRDLPQPSDYIWVLCREAYCGYKWVQEDSDYAGPRPCRCCGSLNTEEHDVLIP